MKASILPEKDISYSSLQRKRSFLRISPIKHFACKNLPIHSPLRNLILSEKELLSCEEYVVKIDIWLKLLNFEVENK